jgi:peptidoglycan/LPS O-acetylase OafA/YrhL
MRKVWHIVLMLICSLIFVEMCQRQVYVRWPYRIRFTPIYSFLAHAPVFVLGSLVASMARFALLRNLGKWSFGIYLLHFDVIWTFSSIKATTLYPNGCFYFCIFTSFLVGYIFYELVEKPIIHLAQSIGKKLFESDHTNTVTLPIRHSSI